MHVTGARRCLFVVWTPHGISVENILYDEKEYKPYIEHVMKNYKSIFAVEVFEKRHPRGLPLYILEEPAIEAGILSPQFSILTWSSVLL